MPHSDSPRFLTRLHDIADDFDALLCDVWGVIHNGIAPFAPACDALRGFRARGGRVVLITNAPRPSQSVRDQLTHIGVTPDVYDAIVSSGDVTRQSIAAREGEAAFHLGPARDKPIFTGLDMRFAALEEAHYIVCTGLFDDETETPEHYSAMLGLALARNLPMICANPDLVAERGTQLIYCAGSLADNYLSMGGNVIMAGKPYAPIYDEAMRLAQAARGAALSRQRTLAIGDSVRTDLEGATAFGLPCLFISGGIHAADFGARHDPDRDALAQALRKASKMPLAVMPALA